MSRYALLMEYDGTNYHGWQIQKNVKTIQAELEKALFKLTKSEIRLVGSGRTDAGVHAIGQVAHFDESRRSFGPEIYRKGLNSYLPRDILVKECYLVPDTFHARFDARRRTYEYRISLESLALGRQYVWQMYRKIDQDLLVESAQLVTGKHDFRSFQNAQSEIQNTVCVIKDSAWIFDGKRLRYQISGDRFLHNMVRSLVGTMIEVARGRFTVGDFNSFIHDPDKNAPVMGAPAHGLVLLEVQYHFNLNKESSVC